ncbi:SIR2 family protein [Haloplasma contractile]|uniref:SIR2-like domain protein n=1 Tax=Haloplasma contractile SSD-17B TaxID=1033810 RepID=F7PTW7_9MOLU|nr:SIR2 family protein [Haloplasma contractile]ERJ12285.1 SIR2-like domain protein [Haloplasma contractile SSD-17B]
MIEDNNIYKENILKYKLDQILSSSHINFLFGAGVNGGGFKLLNGFKDTMQKMCENLGEEEIKLFEESLDLIDDESSKKEVLTTFVDEFHSFYNVIDYNHQSLINLKNMFIKLERLIESSENTIETMSKVNIFTLNYDDIVEDIIESTGALCNVITSDNPRTVRFHDYYVIDSKINNVIPSYNVSKIHGSVYKGKLKLENIITPGVQKYDKAIYDKYFQLLFSMKSELMRLNSVIIIIGYSWGDNHINKLLSDLYEKGLTIIWINYDNDEKCDETLKDRIIEIKQKNSKEKDSTLVFTELLNEVLHNDNR